MKIDAIAYPKMTQDQIHLWVHIAFKVVTILKAEEERD